MGTRRSLLLSAASALISAAPDESRRLHVVCVGGHPDDPESGCGGTLALYRKYGHRVTIVYLTRGEAGVRGKTAAEAAEIRTRESLAACRLLGAEPVFVNQIDGGTEVNRARQAAFNRILTPLNPGMVFTHWTVDAHADHRAASSLTFQWWLGLKTRIPLLFFEVESGHQTQIFHPDFYVDIAETWEKKKEACFLHASQNPDEFYALHSKMEQFRGLEKRVERAEAFVVHPQGPAPLPPAGA